MARVLVPEPLRRFTGDRAEHRVEGRTVAAVLKSLADEFPEIGSRLFGPDGELLPHLMVFLDNRNLRFSGKADFPVRQGSEVRLVIAMEGG